MCRIVLRLAGIAAVSALCHSALQAQTATTSLNVTASVAKNCVISTTPISFGAYDPIGAHRTGPLDGTGTLTVACTKGASAKIELDDGTNSPGVTRRMSQAGKDYLDYQIYKDASRTNVWGDGITDRLDTGSAPSRTPRTFTAYGRVPSGQDVTVGSYTDTVVATVLF